MGTFTTIDLRAALSGADADWPSIKSLDGEAPILLPRKNAAPPVGKIKRPHVEHEQRVVPPLAAPKDRAQ
jgi:hypothetical protein